MVVMNIMFLVEVVQSRIKNRKKYTNAQTYKKEHVGIMTAMSLIAGQKAGFRLTVGRKPLVPGGLSESHSFMSL